jgi:NodT family efflux transporter outer membrane factor (OMF) lipoprotein
VRNGFKVGPNYQTPPAPVADQWILGDDARVQNRHLQDWWRVFQDEKLNELIDTAYRQNLNLRILAARVLEARAQRAIAVGTIFPQTQQMNGGYSRTALSKNTANNPAAIGSTLGPSLASVTATPPFSPLFGNWYSDWGGGFNLSWELDFWGRFRRAIESANANLDASVFNFDNAMVTLLADVATNYVQFRVAQQRIKIARANVAIQEVLVATVEQQKEVGVKNQVDVEQLRTLLHQTRSTIPALEITRGQANDTLCILLGLPPQDLEPQLGPGPDLQDSPPSAAPLPSMPTWAAAGIPADLLRRRPDVRSAERQVAVQSAQIGVAEADLYPTIFVNGTIGLESESLNHLFEKRSFFGTIAPNFRWNILNYGRILNNVRLQTAKTDELVATYQNQVLTAAREVQTALRGFLRSQEQSEDLVRSVMAAMGATSVFQKIYKIRDADVNRMFTLQSSKLQEQDNLAVAQGNIALNLIEVYRALGGGWELHYEMQGCPVVVGDTPLPPPEPEKPEMLPKPKTVP